MFSKIARFAGDVLASISRRLASLQTKGHITIMLTLTDDQQVTLRVQSQTAAGNPAPIDGIPIWGVTEPGIITVDVSPDGLEAVVYATGPVGKAAIILTGDADLGGGVEQFTTRFDIEIIASKAAGFQITAGTPVPRVRPNPGA